MNSTTLIPVALLASLACAQSSFDSQRTHRIEATFAVGGHFGGFTSEDEDLYKDVGLGVVSKDGEVDAVEANSVGIGGSLAYWHLLQSDVSLGAAFQYVNASESPIPAVKGQDPQDLFEASILTARARVLPLAFDAHHFGLELAAGYGFGTLHRFPLAADQIDGVVAVVDDPVVREQVRSYILEGNKPIDIQGPHFEMLVVSTQHITESFGVIAKVGYNVTLWTLTGSDPLQSRVRKYPEQVTNHGVGVQIGLTGSF